MPSNKFCWTDLDGIVLVELGDESEMSPELKAQLESLRAHKDELKKISDDAVEKIKQIEASSSTKHLSKYKEVRTNANKEIQKLENQISDLLKAVMMQRPEQQLPGYKMDLCEFDERLKAILPQNSRPFLCEGSPFECAVFIVGLNPRTRTPFENYWTLPYGCRRSDWLKEYLRRHDGKQGPTRKRIEILHKSLTPPFKCLETNVFPVWSKRFHDLAAEYRKPDVFNFLLDAIKPKLVFVHGRAAGRHIERLAGGKGLPRDELLEGIPIAGFETDIYLTRHLSYHRSDVDCQNLGKTLREHMMRRDTG
jgi:hypothetical protein